MNGMDIIHPPKYPGSSDRYHKPRWFVCILPNNPQSIAGMEWQVRECGTPAQAMETVIAGDRSASPPIASIVAYTLDDGTVCIRSLGCDDGYATEDGGVGRVWGWNRALDAIAQVTACGNNNERLAPSENHWDELVDATAVVFSHLSSDERYKDRVVREQTDIVHTESAEVLTTYANAVFQPGVPTPLRLGGTLTYNPDPGHELPREHGIIAALFATPDRLATIYVDERKKDGPGGPFPTQATADASTFATGDSSNNLADKFDGESHR